MAYNIDKKTGEITINGFEQGIATSPHKGIANIQAGNIATETGEVMCNFSRTQQSQTATTSTGSLTPINGSTTVDLTIAVAGATSFVAGTAITIGSSGVTGITGGATYWIKSVSGVTVRLSATPNGSTLSFTAGGTSATFTFTINMAKPIAKATEPYNDGTTQQYRYYILDSQGAVWVYDTAIADTSVGLGWYLPDVTLIPNASGMAILNGWLLVFTSNAVYVKQTVWLTQVWTSSTFLNLSMLNIKAPHFAFVGHQNILYYTDGNMIGSIFPNNSLVSGAINNNIQSYCSYTAVTTTGTITAIIGGSSPSSNGASTGLPAVPAWFFSTGTKPTAITVGTVYWIKSYPLTGTFEVYDTQAHAIAGGGTGQIDLATGSSGTQYFNTFWPLSVSGLTGILTSNERLSLPFFETAQCLGEIGNLVIIGCKSNILYPWNQIDPKPGDLIPLPENNSVNMITVNNMLYIFAGNKGNIYITNGSTASLVLTVPDYCAGIAGTPSSYVEPYFVWGDAMYLRGRVWFSILDQVAVTTNFIVKAGNCGGIWSFVPTQNFFIGEDTGLALRMENQSSYGSYNGYCTVLLPMQDQNNRSPQYWSGWQSSVTSPVYGIDVTGTGVLTSCIIETDIIPTGTMLEKKTFQQIEYKLSVPLQGNETVSIKYRQNATDAWTSCGTAMVDSSTSLSGYFSVIFEKGQWLQLQITLFPTTTSITSAITFVRLKQIQIR